MCLVVWRGSQGGGGMKPKVVAAKVAADLLHDAHQAVLHSDSFEGSIRWELLVGQPPPVGTSEETFAVQAAYRVGNSMGQGGMVLVGDVDGPQPAELWGPLRGLVDALVRHTLCPDCEGTGRLQRKVDPYRPERGTYSERCTCQDNVDGALAVARKALRQQDEFAQEMQALGIGSAAC